MPDWLDPMEDDERDSIIGNIAEGIVRRRLETAAVLLLEMHKPLTFITSQSLIVGSPLIAPFVGIDNLQSASRLLQDRGNIELLILRIEELAAKKQPAKAGLQP